MERPAVGQTPGYPAVVRAYTQSPILYGTFCLYDLKDENVHQSYLYFYNTLLMLVSVRRQLVPKNHLKSIYTFDMT